jgi:signal transduction histidine kinase
LKFTNANGSVYFHIETDFNKGIKLIIGDTGIGLPSAMSTKIFDRFFQINTNVLNQGSGIGLSITQEFVTLHGGTITVESEEGMGSIFTVSLPLLKKYGVVTTSNFEEQERLIPIQDSIENSITSCLIG